MPTDPEENELPVFIPTIHKPEASGVTEDELRALEDERVVMNESPAKMARRLLEEALPQAILTIRKLTDMGTSDSTRLRAATYIIDRNLGPVGSDTNLEKTPWDELLEAVTIDGDLETARAKNKKVKT